jgi:hypothetical protein
VATTTSVRWVTAGGVEIRTDADEARYEEGYAGGTTFADGGPFGRRSDAVVRGALRPYEEAVETNALAEGYAQALRDALTRRVEEEIDRREQMVSDGTMVERGRAVVAALLAEEECRICGMPQSECVCA